jgi:hypothetical protein
MKTQQRGPRFGVFAEGAHYTSARGWDAFVALWRQLARLHGVVEDHLDVYGVHKGQIELMDGDPKFEFAGALALDAAIALAHDVKPFDVLIVAFDALPANSKLRETGCLAEMRWVFERFLARRILPKKFRADTERLLKHYAVENDRPPRQRAHAPRVDAIFMEPEFETLIVCDERLVRRAFEVGKNPRPWPNFKKHPPKQVLDAAIELAGGDVRRRIRGDIKSNRHGWALEVARMARESTTFMSHNIMVRLQRVLAR